MTVDRWLALDGKVVVVAGAGGGGIGTSVCAMVAAAGASVLALDIRPDALTTVHEAVRGVGGTHRSVVADVRDLSAVEHAVDGAADLGPLFGLVHVAGGTRPEDWSPTHRYDPEVFDEVLALNLRSVLITNEVVGSRLLLGGTGGSIVNIASVAGLSAMPFGVSYAAAKAGVLALTRTAALEWGAAGIRVNAVAPGTVRTPKTTGGGDSGQLSESPERARRVATGSARQPSTTSPGPCSSSCRTWPPGSPDRCWPSTAGLRPARRSWIPRICPYSSTTRSGDRSCSAWPPHQATTANREPEHGY